MRKNLIDLFFMELNRELDRPADVIVTGAAAGALLGSVRPSVDIDFEMRVRSKKAGGKPADQAVRAAASRVGIATNYSEDISRWSMIDFLDYRKQALPYKKIGLLDVKFMAPEYWTIGKMVRYWELDVQDVRKVIRKRKISPDELVSLWARALRASPLSQACGEFRDHVTDFLKRYGKRLWGSAFDADAALDVFDRLRGK